MPSARRRSPANSAASTAAAGAPRTPAAGSAGVVQASDDRSAFDRLSDRHRLFVLGVVSGKPLVRAYREAGYQVSDASAYTVASRLHRSAQIQAAKAELNAEAAERVGVSVDELLRHLKACATFDRRHVQVTNDGVVLSPAGERENPDALLALSGVKVRIRRRFVRGVFLPVPPGSPEGTQPMPAQDVSIDIDFDTYSKVEAGKVLLEHLGERYPLDPINGDAIGESAELPQLVAGEDPSLPVPPPAESDTASGGGDYDLTDD